MELSQGPNIEWKTRFTKIEDSEGLKLPKLRSLRIVTPNEFLKVSFIVLPNLKKFNPSLLPILTTNGSFQKLEAEDEVIRTQVCSGTT